MNFKSDKELFDFVRTSEKKSPVSLKEILSSYSINKIAIDELLKILVNNHEEILLIDSRSENEFTESSIPCSVNFPVLNNAERHNVGLIYKKYSKTSALHLAKDYADNKINSLNKFLSDKDAVKKSLFVYCWRGGGRSGYLSKMISDSGFKSVTLEGGFRSFRKKVNSFFSMSGFPYKLIEISGSTGCGKSELLQSVSSELPVIDLESAARHFSSLLGHIPYEIRNFKKTENQSAFENNLYSQILLNSKYSGQPNNCTYLIESESRRVGNFEIPLLLFNNIQTAKCIKIISSMESRVNRIVRDYFGNNLAGIEPMKRIMKEKEKYFRQQLSNKIYDELMILLDNSRVEEFTEIMIREYYDKKYRDKGKIPFAEIKNENLYEAVNDLRETYQRILRQN